MKTNQIITLSLISISLVSCSTLNNLYSNKDDAVPGYKITVVQGNEITQQNLSQIQPGMSKAQVKSILGQPQLENPFHEDTWFYTYSVFKSGKFIQKSNIILKFSGDQLVKIEGTPESINFQKY